MFIEVGCASHFLVWENQHEILFDMSSEWRGDGTIEGGKTGEFWVGPSCSLERR